MKRKYIILILLLLYLFNLNAQLYNSTKKIEFEVYHIEKKDTLKRNVVYLHCEGERWMSPRNVPIDSSWSITWSYQDEGGLNLDRTGVKETPEKIFLHAIRINEFSVLEFCPFPIVEFPLQVGNQWKWTLNNIPKVYFKNIKKYGQRTTDKVVSNYVVENRILWYNQLMKRNFDCFVIKATGKSSLGVTKLTAYFSVKYGFIMMNFETLNDDTYLFVLKRFPENISK